MKIKPIDAPPGDTFSAETRDLSAQFMKELMALFQKHGMAVVPTYEGRVSFHDQMRVVNFDAQVRNFIQQTDIAVDH